MKKLRGKLPGTGKENGKLGGEVFWVTRYGVEVKKRTPLLLLRFSSS